MGSESNRERETIRVEMEGNLPNLEMKIAHRVA